MDPNTTTQTIYSPQISTPEVYNPSFGQTPPASPKVSNKWKIFAGLGVLIVFTIGSFLIYRSLNKEKVYQKPKSWVISQSLNNTLSKQQLLVQTASDLASPGAEVAAVSTYSGVLRSEVVKIGKDYLLSTGGTGEVTLDLPNWVYKVSIVPIESVDFTGIPSKITIDGEIFELKIGIVEGNGKIKSTGNKGTKNTTEGTTKLKLSLFHDKNGNGQKEDGELSLPWAGITVKLTES